MKWAAGNRLWEHLIELIRPDELAVLLSNCMDSWGPPDDLSKEDIDRIQDQLVYIGLLARPKELTEKGERFVRFSDSAYKGVMEVVERTKLLKSLVKKQDWDALFSTLYTNEKDTFVWISNPAEHDIPLPPVALDACIDSLVTCGLVFRGAGPVSLSPDGVRFLGYMNYGRNDSEDKNFAYCDTKYAKSDTPVDEQKSFAEHEDCLEEAGKIVRGNREDTYGPAERNLSRIAEMWSAYLSVPLTARQVAVMMVLLKASRDAFKPKHDNMVDICGYAYLADILDKGTSLK